MKKKLIKDKSNQMVFGVCSGIAAYLDVDPTLIRLAWVFFGLCWGSGILAYIICAIIIPER